MMIPILKAAAACDFKLFGKIEKIFATYGFVVTADGQRYFFHFGTCITKPEFFRVGDDVEFVLGEDSKTHRLHAQKLYKCSSPPPVNATFLNRAALFSYIPISLDGASSASLPMSQSSPPSSSPTSFIQCVPSQLLSKSSIANRENKANSLAQLQQHSSASIRCVGLILSLPSSSSNIRGYIACEIAGNPTFVRYQLPSLKNPQDKFLIHYGAKVHLTAVWHSQSGTWTAKEIVPEAPSVDVTLSENVGLCEIGTLDYESPQRVVYGGAEEFAHAFSPASTTSISSLDLVKSISSIDLKKSDSQQIEALHFGKQDSWEDYGLFTKTRALVPIGNLPTTPNNAYDKAREAWFSVSG